MKIGIVSTLGGGLGRTTSNLIRGLITQSDAQICLYLVDKRHQFAATKSPRIQMANLGGTSHALVSKFFALLRGASMSFDVDLLHCNYISNTAFLLRYDGNLVLTSHGPPRSKIETALTDKVAYMFERFCANGIPQRTRIVSISDYCRKEIKAQLGLHSSVIYNGIDCNFYKPIGSEDKRVLKNTLGFGNSRIILFVGRLHPIKDPLTLLKAFKRVNQVMPETILLFVGRGSLKKVLENYAQKNSLRIQILDGSFGYELLRLYQAADLFVLPSIGESFGLALVEAMATACPCIATQSGSFPEIIDIKELLVEPNSQSIMAERILYILQNKFLAEKFGEYLHKRANDLFSLEKMAREYYAIYSSMA